MTDRLKPLRGVGAQLLQLVTAAQDPQTLAQALELAVALGQPAEGLLDGIEVTAAGELLPSSRFRGTQAMQPALDLLLIHQLSLAPDGSPEAALRRSVRRLDLVCQVLPALRGFDGLETLAIELCPGTQWPDLSEWGPLTGLRSLVLTPGSAKDSPPSLGSLDGLHAPHLEVVRLRALALTSVQALSASSALREVDLSNNPGLLSIQALAPSAPSLQTLHLQACLALTDIQALQGASALHQLDLQGCAQLQSLQPLSASLGLTTINLEGCTHLKSLEGLAGASLTPPRYSILSLKGCAALTSLRGLPPLSEGTSALYLEDMPALVSLEGIEAARAIETLALDNTGLTGLDGLEQLTCLADVRIVDCQALKEARVLGQMPALVRAKLYRCARLEQLPPVWGPALQELEITAGIFTSIGQLPTGLKELELRGIASLKNLEGAQTASSLQVVAIDTFLQDACALQGLPLAFVRCFEADARPARPVTAAWLQAAVGRLQPLRLDLRFTSLQDLQVLIEFPALQAVQVGHRACEGYALKASEYLTEAAVRTLQRAVCKKHQVPLPDFLKPRRTSRQPLTAGGPSLADLKRGLTSTDFAQVTAALEQLRASASAPLYDAVVEGVYGPGIYSGDTAALGKLFKDIRAPYRPWARWVLTHVLMDAPDAALQAVALRHSLKALVLSISLAQGQEPSRPLPLSRLLALESITVDGVPGNDLSFLCDAGPLQSITLQGLPDLTSLASLATMKSLTTLQTLRIESCPALESLQGLESAEQLTQLIVDGSANLHDFSALARMRSLQGLTARSWSSPLIDLSDFKALDDLGFTAGLQAATSLHLKLRGRVDLAPLGRLPLLHTVHLEVDTLAQDFSPLANLSALHITLIDPDTGYPLSLSNQPAPAHRHVWSGEFPQLEALKLNGGQHDLAQLHAPGLKTFAGSCRMPSLRGVGQASNIKFQMRYCQSLDGLEGSPIESLAIDYNEKDAPAWPSVKVLHQLPHLKTLHIGSGLTAAHASELVGCAQIEKLQTSRFSGSLAFLAGWTQLAHLDLRDSGPLSDLATLSALPSLVQIRLRGSAMKRETWPKALQDRLDFMSS